MTVLLLLLAAAVPPPLPTAIDLDAAFRRPRMTDCDELTCSYDTRIFITRNVVCRLKAEDTAICTYERTRDTAPIPIVTTRRQLQPAPPAPVWEQAQGTFSYLRTKHANWWMALHD